MARPWVSVSLVTCGAEEWLAGSGTAIRVTGAFNTDDHVHSSDP